MMPRLTWTGAWGGAEHANGVVLRAGEGTAVRSPRIPLGLGTTVGRAPRVKVAPFDWPRSAADRGLCRGVASHCYAERLA